MEKLITPEIMEDFGDSRPLPADSVGRELKVVYSLVSNIFENISTLSDYFLHPFSSPSFGNGSTGQSSLPGNPLTADHLLPTDSIQTLFPSKSNVAFNAYSSLVLFCLSNLLPLLLLWLVNRGIVGSKYLSTLLSLSILWLVLLILSPWVALAFGFLFGIRGAISLYLRLRYGGKVFLPSAMDAVWGIESYASTSVNTGLYIIRGKCNFGKIRKRINATVEYKLNGEFMMERLKCSVRRFAGFVCWEMVEDFNVDRQLKMIHDLDPGLRKEMEMCDLFNYLQKVQDIPFSRVNSKGCGIAPWEVIVVPRFRHDENPEEEHYAIIFRINHSLMDGISFGNILYMCLADKRFKFTIDPTAPVKIGRAEKVLGYALGVAMLPLVVVRNLLLREKHLFHGPMLTGQKNFAWSRPIRMDMLKLMKNRSGTSIFSVLMSSVAGSIRHLFESRGEAVPDVIHAAPPIAILPYPDRRLRNKFAIILFPVPIGLKNGIKRVKKIYATSQALARSSEILSSYLTISVLGIMPAFFIRLMGTLAHATLTLSNMPGPAEKVTVFEGDPIVDIGAWVPVKYSIGIGTAMFSYGDRMRVTFIGDEAVLPNRNDIPTMQSVFESQLSELAKSLGIHENIFLQSSSTHDGGPKLDSQG